MKKKIVILGSTSSIGKSLLEIIKKDKKTTPKDLKLDFRFKTCLVAIISEANIQNCVKKIMGITSSGVTAENLISPGA